MWLLPLLPHVAALATGTFYRTTLIGREISREGPLILVGNHPNSLLDPLFLAATARRPIRFLAKAPLFASPSTSWAVKAVGAIPVYRPSDNPALVSENAGMFRAAHDALLAGAAVGIFPEGKSHDAPSLMPLRTGAARIAIGARAALGQSFPIIPIGLVLGNKEVFRSRAHVVIGEPVRWEDLGGTEDSTETVRELTARIDAALRAVTLNLEAWEDSVLIAAAEQIYVAETGPGTATNNQVDRWREAARLLSETRGTGDDAALELARDVRRHMHVLDLFGLKPRDLHADTDLRAAARWSVRRLALPIGAVIAWIGVVLLWPPYRLTGVLVERLPADGAGRASAKLVTGAGLYIVWLALLTSSVWVLLGWRAGVAALILLPILAAATLALLEKSAEAWSDARRFFLLRFRTSALNALRSRQRDLARRLMELRAEATGQHG